MATTEALQDVSGLDVIEVRILEAFANGYSRDQIAARLGVSPRTVGHRLTVAKEKLFARSLTHAAVMLTVSQALQDAGRAQDQDRADVA